MEQSAAPWLSNLEEDTSGIIDQWDLDSLDQLIVTQNNSCSSSWADVFSNSSSVTGSSAAALPADQYYSSPPIIHSPNKLPKSESSGSSCTQDPKPTAAPAPLRASSPTILSFGKPDSPSVHHDRSQLYVDNILVTKAFNMSTAKGVKRNYEAVVSPRASHNLQLEHVMAERKRREKLTQKFIALSAIVPGLKKMDKVTILEDAIKHLKKLEEQVKNLEEDQAAAKSALHSAAVVVKRTDDGNHSSYGDNFEADKRSLLEVVVRLSERSVLVKIHCKSRKGVLLKALAEIESLNLSILSTSVVPFAGSSLDITVMAQIEEGFSMTVKDLVKNLNSALREFVSRD